MLTHADSVSMEKVLTLRFLRSDFGEERHLRHSHEGKAQQLQEHPDDEGRQLPLVPAWTKKTT